MGQYNSGSKILNKSNMHDVNIVVLGDGYDGEYNFAKVDQDGYQYDNSQSSTLDGYGRPINSTDIQNQTALDVRDLKGIPQHFNGTVGISAVTITPTQKTTSVLIENSSTNSTNALLQVSFDNGVTYFDMIRGSRLEIETEITFFKVKSNTTNTKYQIIVTG